MPLRIFLALQMLSEINICAEILADKFCDASDTGRVVAVKE